jgi:hypothetical protein
MGLCGGMAPNRMWPRCGRLSPMLEAAHAAVMHRALDGVLSARALESAISANLAVDALWNQVGHHELHFDDNAFAGGNAYIQGQRALIRPALEAGQARIAWRAFGRLTHTAQDFYSHSNYVALWLARQPAASRPPPEDIDYADADILRTPALCSGKPYLPWGALSFVPGLAIVVDRLMPADSHARMNLDSEARGPAFQYAFHAAIKRTVHEYRLVAQGLSDPLLRAFRGN